MKEVLSFNLAEVEVSAWLDSKRVMPVERAEKQNFIAVITEAIQYGFVSIDAETNKITHTLLFPLKNAGGETTTAQIVYNPRAETANLLSKTSNLKGVGMAVYSAYASTLTGELVATLGRLDSQDFKILQAITSFFL